MSDRGNEREACIDLAQRTLGKSPRPSTENGGTAGRSFPPSFSQYFRRSPPATRSYSSRTSARVCSTCRRRGVPDSSAVRSPAGHETGSGPDRGRLRRYASATLRRSDARASDVSSASSTGVSPVTASRASSPPSSGRLLFLSPPPGPHASLSAAPRAMSARDIQKATLSASCATASPPSLPPSLPPPARSFVGGGPSDSAARPRGLSRRTAAGSTARSDGRDGPMTSPDAMGRVATTRRAPWLSTVMAMLHPPPPGESDPRPSRPERRERRSSACRLMRGGGRRGDPGGTVRGASVVSSI